MMFKPAAMDRNRRTTIESDLWLGCVSVDVHRKQMLQFPAGIQQTRGECSTSQRTIAPTVTTGPLSMPIRHVRPPTVTFPLICVHREPPQKQPKSRPNHYSHPTPTLRRQRIGQH